MEPLFFAPLWVGKPLGDDPGMEAPHSSAAARWPANAAARQALNCPGAHSTDAKDSGMAVLQALQSSILEARK
jgi:hypothetical protein